MTIEELLKEHEQYIRSSGDDGKQLSIESIDMKKYYKDGIILEQAVMSACSFDNLNINYIDFYSSELYESSFRNCNIEWCEFVRAELDDANFSNSTLIMTKFDNAEMFNTDFSGAIIQNCSFKDAQMFSVDFTNAALQNINFDGAKIDHIKVKGAKIIAPNNLDKVACISIDIGNEILEGEKAKEWLKYNAR